MEQLKLKFNDMAVENNASEKDILEELNTQEVIRLIPMIIFLSIISLTGIPGNGLVCYIYRSQYSMSSSRWFIFFLGAVDLLLCIVIIPCEIVTSFQQYTFTNPIWCKFSVFFNLWSLLSLGLTLVIVSVDRYRKVCKPLGWQINFNKGRILCVVAVIVAFVLSSPVFLFYGIYEIDLHNSTIKATECSFRQSAEESDAAFYYVLFGLAMFTAALATICILYCFIGGEIKQHIKKEKIKRHISLTASMARKSEYIRPVTTPPEKKMASKSVRFGASISPKPKRSVNFATSLPVNNSISVCENNFLQVPNTSYSKPKSLNVSMESVSVISDRGESYSNEIEPELSSANMSMSEDDFLARNKKPMTRMQKTKSKRIRRARARKATFSMFLISIAFVLSYLPFLSLLLARSLQEGFDERLSDAWRAVYKFFLRSYFLNCAINPFIYGVSDTKFRKSCRDVVDSIYDRLRRITKFRFNQ